MDLGKLAISIIIAHPISVCFPDSTGLFDPFGNVILDYQNI